MKPTDPHPEALAAPLEPTLVVGEPCPTCAVRYLGKMGPGDYSCATCGMGMVEPCEHWKNLIEDSKAAQPPPVMTEPGAQSSGYLRYLDQVRGLPAGQLAAEPHTLTREELVEKARKLHKTWMRDNIRRLTNLPPSEIEIEFGVELALSLSLSQSARPSGEGS